MEALQFIKKNEVKIAEIVTDCHPQIIKLMREQKKQKTENDLQTKHSVDVWHVGKGKYVLFKKINYHGGFDMIKKTKTVKAFTQYQAQGIIRIIKSLTLLCPKNIEVLSHVLSVIDMECTSVLKVSLSR